MKTKTYSAARWIKTILFSSNFGRKGDRIFVVLIFRLYFADGSFEEYRKFLPLSEKGLQVTRDVLSTVGLRGKLTSIEGQGVHNNSSILSFGEEFEIEIREFNEKLTIGDVRRPGEIRMRSSISQQELESHLGNIEINGDEE